MFKVVRSISHNCDRIREKAPLDFLKPRLSTVSMLPVI